MAAWLTLAGAVAAMQGADVANYGVFKEQSFMQSDAGPVSLQSVSVDFYSLLISSGPFQGQFSNPELVVPGGVRHPLFLPPVGSTIGASWGTNAPSMAQLDAALPPGDYTLSFGTAHDGQKSITLKMPAANFPAAPPHVENWAEAQTIVPGKSFTLRWAPFAGGTADDSIFVFFGPFRTANYPGEPGLPYLDGTATSVEIPAENLTPGAMQGTVIFEREVVVDRASYPGAIGYVGFDKTTRFNANVLPDTRLLVFSRLADPTHLELIVSGAPGLDVLVQSSVDLKAWFPVEHLSTPDSTLTAKYPVAGPARFYRVQAVEPLLAAGIWFGQFSGQSDNGGFGTLVGGDGRAVVVGYNTTQNEGLFQTGFVVAADGTFGFTSQQSTPVAGRFTGDTVTGNFGNAALPGGTFSGTRQSAVGALAGSAGFYGGTYDGVLTGTARAIVSAAGKVFFYTSDATGDGGGFGQINTQNLLSAQTVAGAIISGTLNPSTLTLSGNYTVPGLGGGTFSLFRQAIP